MALNVLNACLPLLVKNVKDWYESDDPEWIRNEERDKLLVVLFLYIKLKNKFQKKTRIWVRHIYID